MGIARKRALRALVAAAAACAVALFVSGATAGSSILYAAPIAQGLGDCSSVANACALQTALNGAAAGDTIELTQAGSQGSSSTYYSGHFTLATSGTSASEQVTIEPAAGVTGPILDGGQNGTVLTISGSQFVTLSGLTIQNGINYTTSNSGGGISNSHGGTLTVESCSFLNNGADDGAAIDNGDGGAGTLTVTGSTFTNNVGGYNGGAIDNGDHSGGHGTLTVTGSTFSGNQSSDGGAIDNGNSGGTGTASVTDSTFSGNRASAVGGAIANGYYNGNGTLTVTGSTFSANTAYDDGGAIDNGDNTATGSLTVTDSTFSGNSATSSGFGDGGAIDNGDHYGGHGTLTVTATTFLLDTAAGHGAEIADGENAGGGSYGNVTVAADVFDGSCVWGTGTWTDNGYNAGKDAACLNGGADDSTAMTDAELGSLADNGGPTKTVEPLVGNPALGLIPSGTTVNSTTLCPTTDQRGVASTNGLPCDAGSVQVPATVPGVPLDVTATPAGESVTLSWKQPASTGGATLSGYAVYEGTSSGGESGTRVNASLVTGTAYTVTGLTDDTTYYFTVTAVNSVGESAGSAEVWAIPGTTEASPPPPVPTWYASPTAQGTGDCLSAVNACTLQTALNDVTAGGVVALTQAGTEGSSGTYYSGHFTLSTSGTSASEPVTIEPATGVTGPILDGGGTGTVLTISGRQFATISGVTIQNGAGISNINSGTLTVESCTFTNDTTTQFGGAIANGSSGTGGAGTLTVADSTFTNDSAGYDGGAIANGDFGSGTLTVTGSTFSGDSTSGDGGAISNGAGGTGTLSVSGSTFTGDSASTGGAIGNGDEGTTGNLTVTDSTFTSNTASEGGAIENHLNHSGGTFSVTGSTFTTNTTTDGSGGAIGNDGGTATIDTSTFTGNQTASIGTDATLYGLPGGAIFADSGSVTVTSSSFSGNDATEGGAISTDVTLGVSGSTFTSNRAAVGGAIENGSTTGNPTTTVSGSSFTSNAATDEGGAISNAGTSPGFSFSGTVAVTSSTFDDNTAASGGAISNSYYGYGVLTVSGSTFSGNSSGAGGAIDTGDGGSNTTAATITTSTFTLNISTNDGGAILNGNNGPNSSLTVTASTFAGDTATALGNEIENGWQVPGYNSYTGTPTVTVSADIFDGSCAVPSTATDAVWTDDGYNVGADASCERGGTGDSTALTGPELGALADNGGSTKTILPLGDSPARRIIPLDTVVAATTLCPTTDQRGQASADGSACDAGAVQSAAAPPDAPASPTATRGVGQVTLNWSQPAFTGDTALQGYKVYEGTSPGGESNTALNGALIPGTSYTATGLSNGTAYYFTISAVDSVGESVASSEVLATPATVPDAPTDVLTTRGNGEVALAWSAPGFDGGTAVTGYRVYLGTSPGAESSTPVNGTLIGGTTFTVTGLTNGDTYYFTVTAVNGMGESLASSEASETPATVADPPASPSATHVNAQVTLQWNAPAQNGGSAVQGYKVYEGTSPGAEGPSPVNAVPVTGTNLTVSGLTNGTTYYFTVTAVNVAGESAPSSEVGATPSTVPGAPGSPTATVGDSQVTLQWETPTSDGGGAIEGYQIYDGATPGGEGPLPVNPSPVGGTSFTATGLTNGDTYYFTVTAFNADGESVASSEVSATPAVVPDAPQSPRAVRGDGQVNLQWDAGSDGGNAIQGYRVYVGSAPGAEGDTSVNASLIAGTSYTVTGLSNGTTYYFTITAVNAIGESVASSEVSVTPASVPDAPLFPLAYAGNGQVWLSWAAPADGGSNIEGYRVYEGTSPGGESGTPLTVGQISQWAALATGLTNGTTYYFTITAYNDVGESAASIEVSATPQADPPGPPTNPEAAVQGDGDVTLAWAPPAYDGGSPVLGYEVYEGSSSGGALGRPVNETLIAGTTFTVTGLTNGTSYYFTITAVNIAGESMPSDEVLGLPRTAPDSPASPTATPGDGQVTVQWTAPYDGGLPPLNYYVYAGRSPGGERPVPVNSGYEFGGTTLTVTGLADGTTYYFTVQARNAGGLLSSPSVEVHATPAAPPGTPASPTATRGNGQVALQWSAPASDGGSPVTGYQIYEGSSPGGESATPVNATLVTGTTFDVTGLTNGHTYYFTIEAVNALWTSAASEEVSATPATVPDAATGLAATAGNAQVTLRWAAPAFDGGGAITGYEVYEGRSSGGESGSPVNANLVAGTSYTVSGLTNGATYYFTVQAVNALGLSAASTEASAMPVTVPDAPMSLGATRGNAQVSLQWAAPAFDGGSPITGYEVYEGSSSGGESGSPVNASLIAGTSYTVSGLTNGTAYDFTVQAVNAVGLSVSSSEVSATPATVPDAATALAATAADSRVTLRWAAPAFDGGSPITGYEVYEGSSSGGESGAPVNASPIGGTSYTVTGLTNGTTYYFDLRAVNSVGNSPLSREVSAIPVKPPGAPTALSVVTDSGQVHLTWTAPADDGGSAITGYDVYEGSIAGGEAQTPLNAAPVAGTSFLAAGLTNGTAYYFVVEALSAVGHSVASNEVEARPAAPSLVFSTQPGAGATVSSGVALTTQPVVTIEDAAGDTVSSTAPVTLAIASQPALSGASLSCASNPVEAVAGVARFSGCAITGPDGNYVLVATSSGLNAGSSSSLTLTLQESFTTPASTSFIAGQANSFTITATGPSEPVITESGTMPAGVMFTGGSGSATLTSDSSLAASSAGIYPITFTATVGSTSESQTFVLAVVVSGEPTDVTATLHGTPPAQSVEVDWAAPVGVTVTGYSVVANDRTAGTSGTPQAADASSSSSTFSGLNAGDSYTFTVTADLSSGGTAATTSNAVEPLGTAPAQTSSGTTGTTAAVAVAAVGAPGTSGSIVAAATGEGTITVATYASGSSPVNSGFSVPAGTSAYDVEVMPGSIFRTVSFEVCDDSDGAVSWYDPVTAATVSVSSSAITSVGNTCVDVTLTDSTTPSIADLTGSIFLVVAAQAAQSLSAGSIPTTALVGGSYTTTITATSGLAVSIALDSSRTTPGACTISGSTLQFTGAGTCEVTAEQAGSASWLPVEQSYPITITSPPSATPTSGAPPAATPTSGAPPAESGSAPAVAPSSTVTKPPAPPIDLGGRFTSRGLVLSWQPASDNRAVDHYELYLDGRPFERLDGSAMEVTVHAFHPRGRTTYTLRAVDTAGNESSVLASVMVERSPRPAVPEWIPQWAWQILRWQLHTPASTRPAARRLPKWFWLWKGWRLRPFYLVD